jgi:hypothetical protein
MVCGAHEYQVVQRGVAALCPVRGVVAMAPSGGTVTPRKGASSISVDECSAHGQGYGAVRSADVQRFGLRAQHHWHDLAVTGDHAGVCGADEASAVE